MNIDELNKETQIVISDMAKLRKAHSAELKSYSDKITALNKSFFDSKLLDKNGNVVRIGMLISNSKNKTFEVLSRSQSYSITHFLGDAMIMVLQEGKKRKTSISYKELSEYTIL